MHAIEITTAGEVRHDHICVGRITWTAPFADLDGAGAWVREDEFDVEPSCDHEDAIAEALDVLRGDDAPAARIKRVTEILEGCGP